MTVLKGKISRQAWMTAPETEKLMEALCRDGGAARFVGGCVRDALANRRVVDIDIATPLKPDEVIGRLESGKIQCVPTGLKHGTVTAIVDGKPFEVTTLRIDVKSHGRHADVFFTDDWKADAARRDFTINAMSATAAGDVYDFFGGMDDLRRGRIVFVGDPETRINEDVLRILRFFRFYAHFGQEEPDSAALSACRKLAPQIAKLSGERIRQETLKILEAPRCAAVWEMMRREGVATHFLPEATNVAALKNIVLLEEELREDIFVMRRLAALLEITAGGLRNVLSGLKFSNAQGAQLTALLFPEAEVSVTMDLPALRRAVYLLGNDTARSLLLLDVARGRDKSLLKEPYDVATAFRAPRFPAEGKDVLALGWPQGEDIGRILKETEKWWIAGDFSSGRTACLEYMREHFSVSGKR